MQIVELLDSVQYITDNDGKKKGVLLDLDLWQKVVQLLEQSADPSVQEGVHSPQPQSNSVCNEQGAEREAAMEREGAAFRSMHSSLVKEHLGQYVAVFGGQLIDSDVDQVVLFRRIRKAHPNDFVWIGPVKESPDEVHVFRSPRFRNPA